MSGAPSSVLAPSSDARSSRTSRSKDATRGTWITRFTHSPARKRPETPSGPHTHHPDPHRPAPARRTKSLPSRRCARRYEIHILGAASSPRRWGTGSGATSPPGCQTIMSTIARAAKVDVCRVPLQNGNFNGAAAGRSSLPQKPCKSHAQMSY